MSKIQGNIGSVTGVYDSQGNLLGFSNPSQPGDGVDSIPAFLSLDENNNFTGILNPVTQAPITGLSMLRDKVRKAYIDQASKPYYSTFWNLPPVWTTGETIVTGQCRSSNGNWYIALTSGTTGTFAPNLTNPLLSQPYAGWYDGAVDGSGTSGVKWVYYSAAQAVYTGDASTSVSVSFSATTDAACTNIYTPVTGNFGTPTSYIKSTRTNSTKQFIPSGVGCTAEFASWVGDLVKSPAATNISATQSSGGPLGITSTVGSKSTGFIIANAYWELNTDSAKLQFSTDQFSTGVNTRVLVDDVEVSPSTFVCPAATKAGLNNNNLYTLISLTGAKKIRNVKIFGLTTIRDIRIQPNASLFYVQDLPLRVMWMGDSNSAGSAEGPARPEMNWPNVMGNKLGVKQVTNISVGGTGFINNGSGYNYLERLTEQTSSGKPSNSVQYSSSTNVFDIVVIAVSGNDTGSASATLQAQQVATFQAARALQPNALIIVHGPFPSSGTYQTGTIACDNTAQAAFAQWNDPNSIYILTMATAPGGQWITGTGYCKVGFTSATGNSSFYVGGDNTHPTDAGINFMGQQTYNAIKTILNV